MVRVNTPLAVRNNNPLNVRFNGANHWIGQLGASKGFCKFDNLEHGCRCASILLRNYVKNGFNTINQIIDRWAPSCENPTSSYKSYVSKFVFGAVCKDSESCGDMVFAPDNSEILVRIALAMANFEIGETYLKNHPDLENDLRYWFMSYFK